jgi:hypothetical protein
MALRRALAASGSRNTVRWLFHFGGRRLPRLSIWASTLIDPLVTGARCPARMPRPDEGRSTPASRGTLRSGGRIPRGAVAGLDQLGKLGFGEDRDRVAGTALRLLDPHVRERVADDQLVPEGVVEHRSDDVEPAAVLGDLHVSVGEDAWPCASGSRCGGSGAGRCPLDPCPRLDRLDVAQWVGLRSRG